MNIKYILTSAGCICLILVMFAGCGERSADREYEKAIAVWKKGDLVRARTLMEKAIRKISGNERKSIGWNQLAIILWQLNETQAATEAFSKSCALSEELTEANLNLGVALLHAKRVDEAELTLNSIISTDPKNASAHSLLGLVEMKKRNWSGASQSIIKAVQANPNDPASHNALALSELHDQRSSSAAVQRLQQVLSSNPDYAPAAYNLAVIHDQWLGNKADAVKWYQYYIAKAGQRNSKIESARKAIERLGGNKSIIQGESLLTTQGEESKNFIAAGSKLYATGNYTDALAQFKKAVKADPDQKHAYYNVGLAYYSLGKHTDARKAFIGALKIDSRLIDARYMLALTHFQQRKWKDAKREAKELEKLDPARAAELFKHIEQAKK